MCQLLGMSCNTPTDFCFSFTGFAERAGRTDVHRDGWGVAFYEGRGVRCFLDVLPAAESPVAALVKAYPIKTLTMVAHIRFATQGIPTLENVHPFVRELWGQYWTFAHNGDLPPATLVKIRSTPGPFRPVGETDSETAFCFLLNRLTTEFPGSTTPPSVAAVSAMLRALFAELTAAPGTICNFLLADGRALYVGCWPGRRPGSAVFNGLHYIVRQHPFATAHLSDCDCSVDFSTVTTVHDRVAVIATKPLTLNEKWQEMAPGDFAVFLDGRPLFTRDAVVAAEREEEARPISDGSDDLPT